MSKADRFKKLQAGRNTPSITPETADQKRAIVNSFQVVPEAGSDDPKPETLPHQQNGLSALEGEDKGASAGAGAGESTERQENQQPSETNQQSSEPAAQPDEVKTGSETPNVESSSPTVEDKGTDRQEDQQQVHPEAGESGSMTPTTAAVDVSVPFSITRKEKKQPKAVTHVKITPEIYIPLLEEFDNIASHLDYSRAELLEEVMRNYVSLVKKTHPEWAEKPAPKKQRGRRR